MPQRGEQCFTRVGKLDTGSSMWIDNLLIWLHLSANIIWIGAIASVALILMADKPDARTRGELAKSIYLKLATPGFVGSFVFGLVRFVMGIGLYGKMPFMHIKLTLALVVIGLHHVIGARAKKMANGDVEDAGPTKILLAVTIACVLGIVFLLQFRIPAGSG
jgi:putative membrane protein